jgi:hypothetical protein
MEEVTGSGVTGHGTRVEGGGAVPAVFDVEWRLLTGDL